MRSTYSTHILLILVFNTSGTSKHFSLLGLSLSLTSEKESNNERNQCKENKEEGNIKIGVP